MVCHTHLRTVDIGSENNADPGPLLEHLALPPLRSFSNKDEGFCIAHIHIPSITVVCLLYLSKKLALFFERSAISRTVT